MVLGLLLLAALAACGEPATDSDGALDGDHADELDGDAFADGDYYSSDGDAPADNDSSSWEDGDYRPTDGDFPADGDGWVVDGDTPDGDQGWVDGDGENASGENDAAPDGDATEGVPVDPVDIERLIREADIYKYDGARLLVLNPHLGLVRIDAADPARATVTGRMPMLERPNSMYMRDDLAVLLVEWDDDTMLEEGRAISQVMLVDVADERSLALLDLRRFDGRIVDTRWVGEIIYVFLSESVWIDALTGEQHGEDRIRVVSLRADAEGLRDIEALDIPGEGLAVTVTPEAALVSTPGPDGSLIHYVDIADPDGALARRGSVTASGEVRDRYKMRLKDGVLTAVSHSAFAGGTTFVETWDAAVPESMASLGFLDFAAGEELHATIFSGDMLYAVTYLRLPEEPIEDGDIEEEEEWRDECWDGCDPLWTIDLSDPADPALLGELIIPGWSEHMVLHDRKLFTVGYSDTWETKAAIFDVADPMRPREDASLIIPGRVDQSDPDALYDFKSFTILWTRKLMLVPVHTPGDERTALIAFDYSADSASLTLASTLPAFEAVRRTFMLQTYLGILADSQLDVLEIANPSAPRVVRTIAFAP